MMSEQDIHYLVDFLWARDVQVFPDESERLNLCLFILMLFYTAARPGAILESGRYVGSGDTLLYVGSETIFYYL
jgi:hypothetical protein